MNAGRVGGGFVTHALRRCFETQCVFADGPHTLIDRWMGHQSDVMGATYFNDAQDAGSEKLAKVAFE